LNACQTPIILTLNAGAILEPEALSRILFTFISKSHCIAASGVVYILNDNIVEQGKILSTNLPKQLIPAMQSLEHLASFLYVRSALNWLRKSMCYSGKFTLFETNLLREVGGFDTQNFSYDSEIIIKLHHYMRKNKYPYAMSFSSDAFCWVEVPATLKDYWEQRMRRHRGMMMSVSNHIGMLFNPKYKMVGLLTFPCYIVFNILGPVVELLLWLVLILGLFMGLLNGSHLLWLLLLGLGFVILNATVMVFLSNISFNKFSKWSDVFKVLGLGFVELFGFRQYRAVCCTVATVTYSINRLFGRGL
jgi:cellulose synthase/poly-beta-1,6-N-acetylglucosamine synthase-like glycosyltransferase